MQASILQKYGEARLPRYTSYPTAPRFSSSIGPVAYADWLAGLPRDEAVSLYLHVPFCRSMCWYCCTRQEHLARRAIIREKVISGGKRCESLVLQGVERAAVVAAARL